jgi:hypothetical protein
MSVKEIVTLVPVEGFMLCAMSCVNVSLCVDIPATISTHAPLPAHLVISLACLVATISENVDADEGVGKNALIVENRAFGAAMKTAKMGTVAQSSVMKSAIDLRVIEDATKVFPVSIDALVFVESLVPHCVEDATTMN